MLGRYYVLHQTDDPDEDFYATMRAIVSDPYPWRRSYRWRRVHPALKDLIKALGHADPARRATTAQALEMPFNTMTLPERRSKYRYSKMQWWRVCMADMLSNTAYRMHRLFSGLGVGVDRQRAHKPAAVPSQLAVSQASQLSVVGSVVSGTASGLGLDGVPWDETADAEVVMELRVASGKAGSPLGRLSTGSRMGGNDDSMSSVVGVRDDDGDSVGSSVGGDADSTCSSIGVDAESVGRGLMGDDDSDELPMTLSPINDRNDEPPISLSPVNDGGKKGDRGLLFRAAHKVAKRARAFGEKVREKAARFESAATAAFTKCFGMKV